MNNEVLGDEVVKDVLLTVGIPSYNRVETLLRCLESIDTKKYDNLEVLICEDKSPKKADIQKMVEEFSKKSSLTIRFQSNEVNLGFDRNLAQIISLSHGKYIMFMSDDDYFMPGQLDKMINCLLDENVSVAYTYFIEDKQGNVKRKYNNSWTAKKTGVGTGTMIMDFILFSGLIFRRDFVINISAERFINLNYFQVYLGLTILSKYGASYFDIPLVYAGGDGENGYGKTELSMHNELLANRKSPLSNLEFHKGLIKAVRLCDEDNNTHFFETFSKEYSLRSYGHLANARTYGIRMLSDAWKKMRNLDVDLNTVSYIYYYMLLLFGKKISDCLLSIPKRLLIDKRVEHGQE